MKRLLIFSCICCILISALVSESYSSDVSLKSDTVNKVDLKNMTMNDIKKLIKKGMTSNEIKDIFGKPREIIDGLGITWVYSYEIFNCNKNDSHVHIKRMLSINFEERKVASFLYSSSLQHF